MQPSVYVYGSAREPDVLVAQEIARGEGFPLVVIAKDDRPIVSPMGFVETVHIATFSRLTGTAMPAFSTTERRPKNLPGEFSVTRLQSMVVTVISRQYGIEVIEEPRNCSRRRRSKSSLKAP
jgi:hypothetical protein